jgi:hypothetical protein
MTQLFIHLNKGFAHALLRMHPAAEKCRIAMTRLIKAEQQAAHNRKCICVWFYAKHRIFVRSFDKSIDSNFMPGEPISVYMYR